MNSFEVGISIDREKEKNERISILSNELEIVQAELDDTQRKIENLLRKQEQLFARKEKISSSLQDVQLDAGIPNQV